MAQFKLYPYQVQVIAMLMSQPVGSLLLWPRRTARMETLNRAVETAREFEEFKRNLVEPDRRRGTIVLNDKIGVPPARTAPPKRTGENRQQYRARVFAKES